MLMSFYHRNEIRCGPTVPKIAIATKSDLSEQFQGHFGGQFMHSDDFRIGGVLRESAAVLRGNFRAFAAVSFLLVGLPVLVADAIILESVSFRESIELGGQYLGTSILAKAGFGPQAEVLVDRLGSLAVGLLGMCLYGAITGGVARSYDGQPVTVRRLLSLGADGMGVVFRVNFLLGLMVVAAAIAIALLSIPFAGMRVVFLPLAIAAAVIGAVVLVTRWSMVVPVAMLENRGAIEALGRSAELSSGIRWRMLGLILLLGVAFLVGLALLLALIWLVPMPMSIGTAIADMLLQVALLVGSAVTFCVAYNQVRQIKEGEAPAVVAKVFD
jgi:hypothetical protein